MNGTTFTGGGVVGLNPGTSWKAIGVGDFDSDGHADILWQNTNGQVAIWVMNGTTIATGGGAIGSNPGTSWKAIGAGDFDGDGHSDILWQNTNGQVAVWTISNFIGNVTGNLTVTGGGLVGANPGSSWHAKAAGDFNADGQSDILFQNSDGTPAIWLTGGGNGTVGLVAGAVPGFNPGTSWSVIGAGDFNGDGKADILWQNTDGTTAVWLMNGLSLISGAAGPFSPGANWHAIAMST